ncbi:MAG: MoxR family ATPase [Acidimicrobiaceae bacterium]|nr:MoxR family ATPase [Acidimicrobiaceae bacterium]MDA9241473.1 MoxR family ATPase [bacterium]MDB4103710.1 MoxR family ATPase [Acidimicrobiales bacterium]HAY69610.1 ATPase [Acidimicrobiaceae bacterium]
MSQQVAETPRVESFTDLFRTMTANIEQVIKGKRDVVQLTLLALLAEGHVLLEDAPGVGKTTIGKALAATLDVPFGRIQFTPDLLPSDVVGVSIWNRSTNEFEFRPGPIFNGIVLADEVNRSSPKTQSALLEAMAERQVTTDGTTRPLNQPFMVIATQNPLDHAGTYPLPESQLDRFLVKVSVGYPDREAELEILDSHGGADLLSKVQAITDTRKVQSMIRAVKSVHVSPALQGYLVDVAEATRRHPALSLGASPRATLALQRMARARAAAAGRNFATPDDVKALAPHVLSHRLMLNHDAELRGVTTTELIDEILQVIPAGAA